MPKIYNGEPLEFIQMVAGEDAIKRERIKQLENEVKQLNKRLEVLQDAFRRDIDGSWFSEEFSFAVDQALTGEGNSDGKS